MKSPKAVVQDWVAAYNSRNPHALIELYHDDAENHQVAFGAPVCGRKALLESFVAFFTAFPGNYTHPENIFIPENRINNHKSIHNAFSV
jgi:ketosteroid isomerase-like protein